MKTLLCALASGVTLEVIYGEGDGFREEVPVAGEVRIGRGPEGAGFSFAWATLLEIAALAAHPTTATSTVAVDYAREEDR